MLELEQYSGLEDSEGSEGFLKLNRKRKLRGRNRHHLTISPTEHPDGINGHQSPDSQKLLETFRQLYSQPPLTNRPPLRHGAPRRRL